MKADCMLLLNRFCPGVFHVINSSSFILFFATSSLLTSLLFAQPPNRDQLVGTWIGVHSEWDIDFVCPLPTYIRLDADSTYQLGMVDGSASPLTSTWSVQGESVRIDTIHYAPNMISVQGDLLRIGTTYPLVFRRFTDIPADSAQVHRQLTAKSWQTGNVVINLFANGKASLEDVVTKQRTAHFWRLARFGSSVFLVIRGNQYTRDGNYKPIWQVVENSGKSVKMIGWNGKSISTETFLLIKPLLPTDSCQASGFQTCDNCYRSMWHEVAIGRSHKRYDVLQLLTKYYQPVHQSGQSGLIQIKFVVNCNGESGLFSTTGFDEDYCPKVFDERITTQLLTLCRNQIAIDESFRANRNPDSRPQDAAITLAFRLKDGNITDILP